MAASDDPRIKFGLSCPTGGEFYICQDSSTRFIGCCHVDPCSAALDGECPTSNLSSASFSASSGGMFLPQSCADPYDSSIWYTCENAQPPFLGCCMNNPCNNGCLEGHLVPAILSEDSKNASEFLLPETTTASATTQTTATSVLPTGTESPSPSPVARDGSARAGMIAGISVAGVVVLLAVIAAYLWVKRREHARESYGQEEAVQSNGAFQATSPVEKNTFLSPNSHRASREPSAVVSSPSTSDNFHSPHLSYLSELEGSSGIGTALHQNSRDNSSGFEGHNIQSN
ncbi:hypothetical protein F5Y03DRAFT_359878 [Xylaria venustula]|nr:hypothetical protein F5Y03DRAFT_359878 [Xylaria venustula]